MHNEKQLYPRVQGFEKLMKNVVIVESPAKAKTINRYLGKDFTVLASFGHIRDLPSKNGSVRPDHDFAMTWEVDDRAKKHIAEIAKAVRNADHLYLATDPDREGEAISWHVQQVLSEQGALSAQTDVQRIVFHEITKTAIQHALANPRTVNKELVDAYLARRALDYLVGFTLSPVLWRKLPGSRSAGRVQSVALRLVVEREAEIEAFTPQEYWSITAQLMTPRKEKFTGRLTHLNGKKLDKFDLGTQSQAEAACEAIRQRSLSVATLEKRQAKRHPAAPFITSTLQQEASRKLGYGASRTMQLAQRLYEGIDIGGELTGLITYMRTDSIQIATEALIAARDYIEKSYGKPYLPPSPRVFKNKSKNAQEAHEAIRPTQLSRRPEEVRAYLDEAQFKLYDLIWKRTIASQMESALFDQVTIDMASPDKQITLRATGSTLTFDGFLKLYQEGVDEDESDKDEEDRLLPVMEIGEAIHQNQVIPNQHFTQPPPRYSEASLVKKLEELGIGRPSTYASIINVLQERDYVRLEKRQFIPEERGRLVTAFLVNFFNKYVQYEFTANLEEELDEISKGQLAWKEVLTRFWAAFHATVESTQNLRTTEVIDRLEQDLSFHLFHGQDENARVCPTCQTGRISLKLSRFGAFLGCSNYPECRYTRPLSTDGEEIKATAAEEPKEVGIDPNTQEAITLRKGPYGYYLQWGDETTLSAQKPSADEGKQTERPQKGDKKTKTSSKKTAKAAKPKRVSLPTTITPDEVSLDTALQLKSLPFPLGHHPDTGVPLSVGLGRFGPYVKFGDQFASIPKTYDFLTLSLEEAIRIVNAKIEKTAHGAKPRGRRFTSTKKSSAKKKNS